MMCFTAFEFCQDVILPAIDRKGGAIGAAFRTACSITLLVGVYFGWRAFGGFCEMANF
jgi:hypothetical protein